MAIDIHQLREYIDYRFPDRKIIYLDLYIKRVKLEIHSDKFLEHINNQIPLLISEDQTTDEFDASIVLFNETSENAPQIVYKFDDEQHIYFYGVKDLSFQEFIKEGHLFVQIFYRILKTSHSSLVHGAVAGLNGNGVLFCARGQRGKSTLTVLSMLNGMEYVSDDYLLLDREEDGNLYAYPLYSIITLSPFMKEKMKEKLIGTIELGTNWNGQKYVFNIANKHSNFRKHYPIKILMFPEILDVNKPIIRETTVMEKGRAITQLAHSTASQTNDSKDHSGTLKLLSMLNKYDCYYFGLSHDIEANSSYFEEFMNNKEF